MAFDYDVFFSYRHKPLDAEITQKTFNAVESYRLPDSLRSRGYQDIHRAFRDTEELPVSRILTDTIDKALHSTNCLVVVCSTDTPSSEWIDREVETFIEIGRSNHIYPLLISGDPEHSFPPSLKLVPDVIDRVMDIRDADNDIRKMMAKEETELLRVISGVAGCRESELLREHKLRKSRRIAMRAGAAAAAFVLVAAVSLGLMNLAQSYRATASRQEAASMRILSELTYGIPDHLTNVPGAYGRIADILRQNTVDIDSILQLSPDQESAAFESAANYEKLANAGGVLGQYDDALHAQQQALDRFQALADQGAEGALAKLASAYSNQGNLYKASGRYREASSAYENAIERQLEAEDNPLQLAGFYLNAGANAVSAGDEAGAIRHFRKSLELLPDPANDEELEMTARTHLNYGLALYHASEYPEAEEHLNIAKERYLRLLKNVDSLQYRAMTVQTMSILAKELSDAGKYDESSRNYKYAIKYAEDLAQDKSNIGYQRTLADLYNNYATSLNIQGKYADADTYYVQAAEIFRGLSERTAADSDWAKTAMLYMNVGENAFKLTDYPRSKACFEDGLRIYEAMLNRLNSADRAQYYAWLSYYRLIHERNPVDAYYAAYDARELQPDNVLVKQIFAYACLYNGYYEAAEELLQAVAELGQGQVEMILRDFESLEQAGLTSEHIPEIRKMLGA